MALSDIPQHHPADAERFKGIFHRLFESGSIHRVVFGRNPGYPTGEHLSSGLTRVPFIVICMEGVVEIGCVENGAVAKHQLLPAEAVFMKSDTWIYCDHSRAPLYLRITIDTDRLLFGCEQKTQYQPLTRHSTQKLEIFPCIRILPSSSRALVQRLESPPACHGQSPWELHSFNLLLTDLYQNLFLTEETLSGKGERTWQSVRMYLEEHCGFPLTRKNVSASFGISPNHISRLFARFSESGFNETLERLRMEKATGLLRSSPLTVSEIAVKCGYSGANYFIRAFGKKFEMTPGKYREAVSIKSIRT